MKLHPFRVFFASDAPVVPYVAGRSDGLRQDWTIGVIVTIFSCSCCLWLESG
ncbi:MAG: hypothetical protein GWP04_04625 [Gammaproteobacteria bacterium]|nr:hypothetical protein [Gammaproteobacteria bacterium]